MGQKLHIFKAETLEKAYKQMRTKLGDDAVVVRTNHVREPGWRGLLRRKQVEVTAAGSAPKQDPRSRKRSAAERKYVTGMTRKTVEPSDRQLAYFEGLIRNAQERMQRPAGESRGGRESVAPELSTVVPFRRPGETPGPEADRRALNAELRREVREMRQMVEVLYAENPGAGLPPEFAPHYRGLVAQGCSRKAAAALVGAAIKDCDEVVLHDARAFRERLKFQLRKRIHVTGGLEVAPGTCRVAAVVGATGVGKTTTLAKLAAQFAVRERARVALVTSDTYRIAAPEQLRVYANIIGLPMRVVNSREEMRGALKELSGYDLVLIDTAGGSQFNARQIQELNQMLTRAETDEVLLLVSANTQLEDLRHVAANFRCLEPTSLVFTKLDETRRYGALYSLLLETGLPLSYVSVGQNVPDDITVAQPRVIADLIMEGRDNGERPST
jgi:flagellar biosynthesis protein FlhF